ncbi:MAG TPA: DUF2304 domain-containing protein [Candidatus Ozemobacteraceae bacterium]|nr:DUF2304 domain-containing protein [Candidatus Ozemobacteraceae bacterium]
MSNQFDENSLPPRQKAWVLATSGGIFYLALDLVRRRKLREDDSWLWLFVGVTIFILGLNYRLLKRISTLLGIVVPTSTIFFFGLLFLMLLALQGSLRHTRMTRELQVIIQELAFLREHHLKHQG